MSNPPWTYGDPAVKSSPAGKDKGDGFVMDHCHKSSNKATEEHLIAFKDGSYKVVQPIHWKHSQWIHYTKENGQIVMINPANVNYIEKFPLKKNDQG